MTRRAESTAGSASEHFETLFSADPDPWHYRTRWYEQRKRDVTLASLLQHRYENAFEPGCANGELSAALAGRCNHLLASDGSASAVAEAQRRVANQAHVTVEQGSLPNDWPSGKFDLIVLSEIAYYLEPLALEAVVDLSASALTSGGTLIACHWRQAEGDYVQKGDEVHRFLHERLVGRHRMARLMRHEEDDFLLELWSNDARSVAQREGIRE